ncbi:MAG: hypothetical protein WA855_03320 [Candidatus Acidiferrales bacterium]
MEADISILRKTGHFYFALTRARSVFLRVRNAWLNPGAVSLPTGFVFSARRWTIGVIDQNVIVTGGAEHAVDCLAELGMLRIECVIGLRFRA